MSSFEIVNKSVSEIYEYLKNYGVELRQTKFKNTYLIKFDAKTKSDDSNINQLRGLIFNSETKQIYSMTYPVPIEYKDQSFIQKKLINSQLEESGYIVQEALDGTLLRLWFHQDTNEWILSTNGVEDANHAYWMNGVSFGSLFSSILTPSRLCLTNLNKDYVYLFSLTHPLNVIVVNHTIPHIYHVATYNRLTMKEIECDIGIEHPSVLKMTLNEVLHKIVDCQDTPVLSVGYMVIQKPNEDGIVHRFRFENSNYTKARALRGTSNNITLTLLGHLLDEDPNKLGDFLMYYPIYQNQSDQLIINLMKLINQLYQEYGQRFKQHLNINVSPSHHKFLYEIHTQLYLNHRLRSIQRHDIMTFTCQQSPDKVLYLLDTF